MIKYLHTYILQVLGFKLQRYIKNFYIIKEDIYMPSKTVQKIYEEIRSITDELKRLNTSEEFLEVAKSGNADELNELFDSFKQKNPELISRILELGDDLASDIYWKIFISGNEEPDEVEDLITYNPREIDPVDLCILSSILCELEGICILGSLFEDYECILISKYLTEAGKPELASYVQRFRLVGMYSLVAVYRFNNWSDREIAMYFFNEVKELSEEIGKLNLPIRYLQIASNLANELKLPENEGKFNEINEKITNELREDFENFMSENAPRLKKRMINFYMDYHYLDSPKVFSSIGIPSHFGTGFLNYNPNRINPLNLLFLFIFSNGIIGIITMFVDVRDFEAHLLSYLLMHHKSPSTEQLIACLKNSYFPISFGTLLMLYAKD